MSLRRHSLQITFRRDKSAVAQDATTDVGGFVTYVTLNYLIGSTAVADKLATKR